MAAAPPGRSLLSLLLLQALAACAATPPAAPTALEGSGDDDPWSRFASRWSPEVQAKINALKAQVKKATAAADAARSATWAAKQRAAEARQREAETAKLLAEAEARERREAPGARAIEARIEAGQRGWRLAAACLLGVVLCGYAFGHCRGAWALAPLSLAEPLLPLSGGSTDEKFKVQAEAVGVEPPRKCLDAAQAPPEAAQAGTQDTAARRVVQELQDGHAQAQAESAKSKAKEVAARKALREMQARAEKSVAQAEAQEAAAVRALQELQRRAEAEVGEARAREAAVKRELEDVQARARASVARAEAQEAAARRAAQEMQEELLRLRGHASGPPQSEPYPRPDGVARAAPDGRLRGTSPAAARPGTPAGRPVRLRAVSPTGCPGSPTTPGTPSAFASASQHHPAVFSPPRQPRQSFPASVGPGPGAAASRLHLVAEPDTCPAVMGGYGVGSEKA